MRYLTDGSVMLVLLPSCVTAKPYGLLLRLGEAYPYFSLFAERRGLYDLNRTVISDRDILGTVKFFEGMSFSRGPLIAAGFAQFGGYLPIEEDPNISRILERTRDSHFKHFTLLDTSANRVKYFKIVLSLLVKEASARGNLTRIIFPSCFFKHFTQDGLYEGEILPALEEFARLMEEKEKVTTYLHRYY